MLLAVTPGKATANDSVTFPETIPRVGDAF